MHETDDDLRELQRVLDESYAAAGEHMRSIFTPERRMAAEEVVRTLRGVFLLHLATVTAAAEPFVAPIDGLFFRGRLWFGVPPGAVRIRHLRARPQVSATYTQGEDLCVIVHGVAHEIDTLDPEHADFMGYCREVYGAVWDYSAERYRDPKGSGCTAWIEPGRLYASAMRREAIG
jgi:hypothetical protein